MKKDQAVNTFDDGLILDLNPLSMPNNALSNCLNGTFLTFNGNENMLLNDMGNARVETAMLPSGYIPLGSTSFGGIIYIISYNPIEKKCLIGSFPSPERNLTKDELGDDSNTVIDLNRFTSNDNWKNDPNFGSEENDIINYQLIVNLSKSKIYSGDKYKIFSDDISLFEKYISAWDEENEKLIDTSFPKLLKIDVVSTLDDGTTIDVTNNSVWTTNDSKSKVPYYIYNGSITNNSGKLSIDEYRGLVSSNYDTYASKYSGQLGIKASLEVPTSFSASYSLKKVYSDSSNEDSDFSYDLGLFLKWSNDHIDDDYKNRINPEKIKIEVIDSNNKELFEHSPIEIYNEVDGKDEDGNYFELLTQDFNEYLKNPKNEFGDKFRKNNGDDFYYYLPLKGLLQNIKGKITIKVTPVMSFGKLSYLTRIFEIDLDRIESDLQLYGYLYYVELKSTKLKFSISGYYPNGDLVSSIDIYCADFRNVLLTTGGTDNGTGNMTLYKSDFYETFKEGSEYASNATWDEYGTVLAVGDHELEINIPKSNDIWLVKFVVHHVSGLTRSFFRPLFASGIFNADWKGANDFKDLYLYSPNLKSGITLSIGSQSENENYTKDEDLSKLNFYNNTLENKILIVDHEEKITLNRNLAISSDNVIINAEFKFDETATVTTEVPEFSSVDVKDKVKVNTINLTLNIEDTVKISNQYNIEYKNTKTVDVYKSSKLIPNNSRINLAHTSENEKEGYLTLTFNSRVDYQYICADQNKANFHLDPIVYDALYKIITSLPCDYLKVYLGVESCGDDNQGSLHEIIFWCNGTLVTYENYLLNNNVDHGTITYESYIKHLGKLKNAFAAIDCVKCEDGVILIMKPTAKFNGKSVIVSNILLNEDDSVNDLSELKNYYKYIKTGSNKTLYTASNIEYTKNPEIKINYNIGASVVSFKNIKITLESGNSLTINNNEEYLNNFKIESVNDEIYINIPITYTYVNDLQIKQLLSTNEDFGISESGNTLYSDALKCVYKSSDMENPHEYLELDALGLCMMKRNFFTNTKQITHLWRMGWEDTSDNFYDSKQQYCVFDLYSFPYETYE